MNNYASFVGKWLPDGTFAAPSPDIIRGGWQLSLVYHSTRSTQRDVLYVVNAEKMRSYRIGFTLGL